MSQKSYSGIKRGGSGKKDVTTLEYKEFEATPKDGGPKDDTYDYGYDGAETTKWFEDNSNFRTILGAATAEDRDALEAFTTGHFMNGQQYLGFSSMSSRDQRFVRSYDKMLDQAVMRSSVTLTRSSTAELLFGGGKKTATLEELQSMKGRVVTSKANLSSAAAKRGLTIGDGSKQIEYKIHVPAGSKGAGMYIGVNGYHAWGERQREFMINRDTDWRVGDTRYNKKTGMYEVDLYFQGLLPHDYR